MHAHTGTLWTRWRRHAAHRSDHRAGQRSGKAAARYRPGLSFALSLPLALLGYGALLLFPVLGLWLLLSLPGQFLQAGTLTDFTFAGLNAVAALLAGLFSWQLLRLRPAPPAGPILDPALTPALHQRIDALAAALDTRAPERICLTQHSVLRIVPTPRYGLPWGMRQTLKIGFPLLECLNPAHLDVLLARCLGQHGARHCSLPARLNHWLASLRLLWPYYAHRGHPAWPLRPVLHGFFSALERVYARASLGVAQRSAGDADRYALDVYNDRDVLEALAAEALILHFLKTRFWPAYLAQADRQAVPAGYPYPAMGHALHREPRARLQAWLDAAMSAAGPQRGSSRPALAQRLEGIGHLRAWLPDFAPTTAAQHYLASALPELRRQVGRDWLGHSLPSWRQRHARAQHERKMLQTLQARARHTPLSAAEAWRCARLADRHLGRQHALPLYRAIAQRHPDEARLQYAVGRLLLAARDPTGLKALQRAMRLNPGLRGPIMGLIKRATGKRSGPPTARVEAHAA